MPADAPRFTFKLVPQKLSGPEPPAWYSSRSSFVIKKPGGTEIEAYGGYDSPKKVLPGHGFESKRTNRRHLYGRGGYHPQDVYIGKREDGKLRPSLFFRDVSSHGPSFHFALDNKDRCHLAISDVDMGQYNRFKLYWLMGDLKTGKWTDAWLIDYRDRFTSSAHPLLASWKEDVHLVWAWSNDDREEPADTGIFHVRKTPADFDKKVRIHKGPVDSIDIVVDPNSGQLLVVFNTEKGVFVTAKPTQGKWTQPVRLHPDLKESQSVSVEAAGNGRFIIRTKHGKTKEWLLSSN